MPAPLKLLAAIFGLVWLASGAVQAAPQANTPAAAPDYGGRDSGLPAAIGEAAPDPAASAGRAFEALVVVLAGVGGVVYVLKRFNLVKLGTDGKPARIVGPAFGRTATSAESQVKVVSSQTLPGGALLHVVQIGERTLLLGATAQSVTNITEWDTPAAADEASLSEEFEGYLSRADPSRPDPASGIAAANARLLSLLSPKPPEDLS